MSSTQPNDDVRRPARATFHVVLPPLVFMLPFKEDLGGGDGKKIQEKPVQHERSTSLGTRLNSGFSDGGKR